MPAEPERQSLSEAFGCPALLVESALRPGSLPKVDVLAHAVFVRLRMAPSLTRDRRRAGHLAAFLADCCLITIHSEPLPRPSPVEDGRTGEEVAGGDQDLAALLGEGPDLLLHEIAARVLDPYFAAFEEWRRRLDHVENVMLTQRRRLDFNMVVAVRHDLLLLSHGLEMQRETIARLGHGNLPGVSEAASRRFSLLAEEALHLVSLSVGGRELVQNLFDLYVSIASQRTNVVMQRLTVVTTVLLPLTLITGIYGMNFDNMPELHLRYAYPATLTFMAVVGFGLYWWFRRTGWFGED